MSKKDFKVIEAERCKGDPHVLISGSQKAMKILGWRPQYANIEIIVETTWRQCTGKPS
jgi:UDP-glucose 4-epimerase